MRNNKLFSESQGTSIYNMRKFRLSKEERLKIYKLICKLRGKHKCVYDYEKENY